MVLAVMGAMQPPIPPSTQQSCDCLSRREVSTFTTLVCQSDLSGLRSGSA